MCTFPTLDALRTRLSRYHTLEHNGSAGQSQEPVAWAESALSANFSNLFFLAHEVQFPNFLSSTLGPFQPVAQIPISNSHYTTSDSLWEIWISAVLAPLVNEVHTLEEDGVVIKSVGQNVKGTIFCDNLAGSALCSHRPMVPQPYVPTDQWSHSPMFPHFLRLFSKLNPMAPHF